MTEYYDRPRSSFRDGSVGVFSGGPVAKFILVLYGHHRSFGVIGPVLSLHDGNCTIIISQR